MQSFEQVIHHALMHQHERDLYRVRKTRKSAQQRTTRVDDDKQLNFASNDYLGLANHPDIIEATITATKKFGVGSGSSFLISGYHRLHHELEQLVSSWLGFDSSLLFSSGYMANLAALTSLASPKAEIFLDRLSHASLIDAAILSRAKVTRYRHLDYQHLETRLKASQSSKKIIVTESIYSMNGDIADIKKLSALSHQYDCWLHIDDAHGVGILGQAHQGVAALLPNKDNVSIMAGFGKAIGTSGAAISSNQSTIDYLLQKARPYIYTTAIPVALANASIASIKVIQNDSSRHQHLSALINDYQNQMKLLNLSLFESSSPIQSILVGNNKTVMLLCEQLLAVGIWVQAIRPPTVPNDTARIRISLTANHQLTDIDTLIRKLKACPAYAKLPRHLTND